jgi:hypothetical protein
MMNDEIADELEEFFKDKPPEEPAVPPEETPPEEPPAEEPPEAPPEEPPVEEPPEEPPAEPPPEEPPAEPPPEEPPTEPSEMDQLRAQNEALLARVEELSGTAAPPAEPPVAPPGESTPPAATQPAVVPEVIPEEIVPYVKAEEFEEMMEDPTKFNEVLNNVAARSAQVGGQAAVEQVLRSIPELVVNYVSRHNAMQEMVTDFYSKNDDLVGARKTVASVANEIAAEHSDWDAAKIFDETAVRTRKVLGMKERVADPVTPPTPPVTPKAKGQSPALPPSPGGSGRGTVPEKLSGVAKEIDDLLID